MNRLDAMKTQGINEMVLDLRYNSGGAVSSAIALASSLVKNRSTTNVLTTSQYNSIVHNELLKEYGTNYNKDYFIDKVQGTTISIPALNLPRLYVLTSGWTASASEFVINGLKPYMDVTLIGETTYGKNVGSISIYEENDPKNKWGMQPIVVKYFNSLGHSDFTAGFRPNHDVDEFANLYLYEFGIQTTVAWESHFINHWCHNGSKFYGNIHPIPLFTGGQKSNVSYAGKTSFRYAGRCTG